MLLGRVVNRQTLPGDIAFEEPRLRLEAAAHGGRQAGGGVHFL